MTSLSPLTGRIVAVGLVILAIALPFQLIIRPILAAFDERQQAIADQRRIVQRLQTQIRARPALEEKLEALGEQGTGTERYLVGENDALAAAHLQARVRAVIDEHGGTLTSTQILDAAEEDGFRKLAVSLRMSDDIESLQQILYELETGSPVLFVETLDIVGAPLPPVPGRNDASRPPLNVSMNVAGYLPPGGKHQ